MAKKLFVGGLPWATTDARLSELFAQVGTVVSATIITDKFSGKSKGFGFVEMSSDEEAEKAIQQLNGQSLDGRAISVSEARPREPRDNNAGGGNFQRRNDWQRGGGGGRDSRGGGGRHH